MAEILLDQATRRVLLFSETNIGRPALADAGETLVEVTTLPAGIAKNTTRYTTEGVLEQIAPEVVNVKADVLQRATLHAERLAGMVNPVWLHTATGTARALTSGGNETETAQRWQNCYHWVLSPLVCIKAIVDSTDSNWNDEAATNALAAYQSLIPADPERISFWYTNHARAVYTAYREIPVSGDSGRYFAWFNWIRTGAIPGFASDATASIQWNGTNNTLLATIPKSATTGAEAVA